jgi:hypothetical protein
MSEPSQAPLPITLILADQRRRWECGDRILVEAYCQKEPGLRNAPQALLDLICGEMVLRERRDAARRDDGRSRGHAAT